MEIRPADVHARVLHLFVGLGLALGELMMVHGVLCRIDTVVPAI
jgi:hypothetical protein